MYALYVLVRAHLDDFLYVLMYDVVRYGGFGFENIYYVCGHFVCDRAWYCFWWLIGTVCELFSGMVYHVFDIVWEWWDVGEMG